MLSTSEGDTKQVSHNLTEALAELPVLIKRVVDKFGAVSPEVADCYLELRGILLREERTVHSEPNPTEASPHVLSQGGAAAFDDPLLIRYLLHDPSHREDRLQEVEFALISSLDEWIDTHPEKVRKALFVLLELASCWEVTGNSSRADALTGKVAGLCQEHLEPTDALTVRALIDSAAYCLRRGKADEAESLLKPALKICEANPEAMGCYGHMVLMNLASVAALRGQMPVTGGYLEQALQAAERVPEPDRHDILEVLCSQAKLSLALNQTDRFDEIAARALDAAKEYWSSDPDFAAECMMTLFALYQYQGRYDEAKGISRSLTRMMTH